MKSESEVRNKLAELKTVLPECRRWKKFKVNTEIALLDWVVGEEMKTVETEVPY